MISQALLRYNSIYQDILAKIVLIDEKAREMLEFQDKLRKIIVDHDFTCDICKSTVICTENRENYRIYESIRYYLINRVEMSLKGIKA